MESPLRDTPLDHPVRPFGPATPPKEGNGTTANSPLRRDVSETGGGNSSAKTPRRRILMTSYLTS